MIAAEQARICAAMAACGMALGGVYDVLGLVRRGAGAWAVDLTFGLLCALAVIAAGLRLETDVFRLYTFLGVALGMAAYMLTIGAALRGMRAAFRRMGRKRKMLDKNLHHDAGKGKRRAN